MGTPPMRRDLVKTLLSTSRQRAHADARAELTDMRALLVSLQTRMSWQAAWKAVRPPLAYAVAYVIAQFASAKLAYAMSPRIAGPSPLFIHGGVAISALLLTRPRQWWRYLLLTFPLILVDAWWLGLFSAPTGWWVIVVAYLQVVIMAVVTAGLLRRFAVVPLRFATVGEVGRFLAIVALGVLPASLFSTAARYYIWSLGFWFAWRTAYLGFVLGIMTFGPAIVLWVTDAPRSLNLVRNGQQKEAALLGLATAIVSVLVFGTQLQDQVLASALIYTLVPVLIWAAVRFGPLGLASTLAFSTAIAVTTAANNRGPFVTSSAADNVLALQLFLLCIGVPLLFLAALVQERKQADIATRASEARYRAMFHSAAIGVAVVDLNGRPLEVNEYVSRMVGYTPDELRTMGLRDFTHPDDVKDNEALLCRALSGEIGSYQLEKRYLHHDGNLVWGRLSVSLVRDQDGQPAYFVVHLEDISRRKQLEHEREEQTAQLGRIFAGIADGLVVYDAEGQVVRTNPAIGRLLGLSAAPASTVPYPAAARAPLFAPRDAQGRPLPPGEGPLARVLRGEVRDGVVEQDVRLQTLDGREVEVATSTAPLRDAKGHLLGAVSILHDQTERNRLEREREAALREAERQAEELDRIFEQSAEGLAVYDAAGRLVRTNAAQRRLLGLDMAGANYGAATLAERAAAYQPRDLDGHPLTRERSPVLRTLQGEVISGAQAVDMQLRTWDGRDLVIRASAAPLRDREGRIVGAVSIVRDHTERQQLRREREEARAQAEQRAEELDRVFEAMADGVAVYDQHGREVRTNTALQRLLRMDLAPPEYADLSLRERMALFAAHDEQGRWLTTDDGPLPRALRGELATGSATMDIYTRAFDGRELELSVSAAPLRDGAGHVTGAVALFRDQTERRRLEREHAEQAQQLQTMFDALADPLFVYDATGRLLRANPAARQLLHAEQTDPAVPLTQRPSAYHVRDADGRPLPREDWPITHLLHGEVLAAAGAQEVLVQLPDGRDAMLSYTGGPIYDAQGQLTAIVAIARDQTERNQLAREHQEARAQAERQAEQLDRVFEQMAEGVVVYDRAGHFVRANAAIRRLLAAGEDVPDGRNRPLRDWSPLYEVRTAAGQPLAPTSLPAERALRGEHLSGPDAVDLQVSTPGGRDVELRVSGVPLRDRGGQIIGAVCVYLDQTEHNQLAREREEARANELALREVNERLDTFAAMAAHDLRSPVGVSRMVVERAQQLLLRAVAQMDEHAAQGKLAQALIHAIQAVDNTAHSLDGLWRLVQQLLDVSRVKQGTLVLQRQPVDMAEVVRTCVDEQRLLNPSRVITVGLPDPATDGTAPLFVDADPDRLSQVLTNYLTNAVRYSPDDQPIEVGLQIAPPTPADVGGPPSGPPVVQVAVRDHGPGIPLGEQATIWERFQRARTTREASGGLGLGLYIARMIVDLHGGQVGVESLPGEGATFWFTLPRGAGPASG